MGSKTKSKWNKVGKRVLKLVKVFWNKIKENSWLLTTNCSTNHANLLVIVTSHRSLAITSPWLQEMIQSMAHKIVLLHSNNTFIPHNKLQATIKSSKPVRSEHEIKLALQVSGLDVINARMLESIIMSHQWFLHEQGLVEAIRFMWIIKWLASWWLVVRLP